VDPGLLLHGVLCLRLFPDVPLAKEFATGGATGGRCAARRPSWCRTSTPTAAAASRTRLLPSTRPCRAAVHRQCRRAAPYRLRVCRSSPGVRRCAGSRACTASRRQAVRLPLYSSTLLFFDHHARRTPTFQVRHPSYRYVSEFVNEHAVNSIVSPGARLQPYRSFRWGI
jgi:hypothetical protein